MPFMWPVQHVAYVVVQEEVESFLSSRHGTISCSVQAVVDAYICMKNWFSLPKHCPAVTLKFGTETIVSPAHHGNACVSYVMGK
jgi:hypothetical protein